MDDSIGVKDILRNKILSSGRITFAEFMETVLYHDPYGYYSSERTRIGRRGDYYTSSSVHPVFGELLCNQIREMWPIAGGREFTIVEMGAGDGSLSCDILRCVKRGYPDLFRSLRYVIIEESRRMRKTQRQNLTGEGLLNDGVQWAGYSDPLFDRGITGCFFSNELVDAFPVHVVEKRGGELQEVFVDYQDNAFTEVLDSPSTPEISRYFDRLGIVLEEGQRGEVNLRAIEWIRWVAKALKKGFVITIDYGYPAEELYDPNKRAGTLLCYHRHRVVEDPFINIGEQDMTTHVDFTTLTMTGEETGLLTAGFTDQMHFLFGLGIIERIGAIGSEVIETGEPGPEREAEALKEKLRIKTLIMPERMGNIFKVLIQYKGLSEKPELSGLKKIF
ncbi:MAG: SAM-dependent methyltransferase [Nitrospirae bacterium]|nr:SAM-dependent methyltransferase [Nitrospirota bacterium]